MVTFVLTILTYNHGHNIFDKFIILSKIGISMERFAINNSKCSSAILKIWILDG